jgi:hypothetical protein
MLEPVVAKTDAEIAKCFPVLSELRPHLEEAAFVAMIRDMEKQGFRLAYILEGGEVVAAAGYRIFTSLFMGKDLYIDDLGFYFRQGMDIVCYHFSEKLDKLQ